MSTFSIQTAVGEYTVFDNVCIEQFLSLDKITVFIFGSATPGIKLNLVSLDRSLCVKDTSTYLTLFNIFGDNISERKTVGCICVTGYDLNILSFDSFNFTRAGAY